MKKLAFSTSPSSTTQRYQVKCVESTDRKDTKFTKHGWNLFLEKGKFKFFAYVTFYKLWYDIANFKAPRLKSQSGHWSSPFLGPLRKMMSIFDKNLFACKRVRQYVIDAFLRQQNFMKYCHVNLNR